MVKLDFLKLLKKNRIYIKKANGRLIVMGKSIKLLSFLKFLKQCLDDNFTGILFIDETSLNVNLNLD